MAAIAATQQPLESAPPAQPQLTKPADWSHFMVAAALKFVSGEKAAVSYSSADEARLDILNTLNWFEAHAEYEWPSFTRLGYDFSQAMRFRRALVSDVFVTLQRSSHLKVTGGADALGTPDSARGGKRAGGASRRMAERKRHCKREDESDTDTDDASDKPFWDDGFLAETMNVLINRSKENIMDYLRGEKDPDAFANLMHDELVSVWEGPLADNGPKREDLKQKSVLWAERNKTPSPRHSSPELGEPRPKGRTEPNSTSSVPVSR
ncbi:hypothetical protein HBI25_213450 [Parastagonospora nodorum]|nr:hypothetical protein HBI95_005890 [Parastagonospora nodorum]KAH4271141.1 hypothetical protein HBI03_034380 [Parastagonospora nodorum]KAH4282253.1 hypothetical protein HBI04_029210 [Parastagonospora nodorum]KAH5158648.1 hypothetical protein HBH69_061850 [Parastagonospora nodorum]KAH5264901.1 hypothetical protein HBI72_086280 [Parastagonospora nodorum]